MESAFSEPLRILKTYKETIVDGEGLRYSIYFAGCGHACRGCHNPESWNPRNGALVTSAYLEEIVDGITANPLLDGITLSGGDPFYYPKALYAFLEALKTRTALPIWCYTGYTYDELIANSEYKRCLRYIDVVVDGPYVESLASPTLSFRGSSNQRVIRVPAAGNVDDVC